MIYKNIDLHASIFCGVSEDMAKEYIDYRIKKKKPLTQGAFNRAVNQAAKCSCTPDEALELTIDKGWDGVTPEYIHAELGRRFDAVTQVIIKQTMRPTLTRKIDPQDSRARTLEQDLTDKSWAN